MIATNLIGRRAVYNAIRYGRDNNGNRVELGRTVYPGEITALIMEGTHHSPSVVMLYDDGTLRSHSIVDVIVEPHPLEPYR